ncbi:riboflavin synthase subunit alpha [Corynebacterium sp. HMSC067D03]|uniref:riboflavin synthase n=1 Tax=Corynebacterium TaxID=1716 RepID=UPI0008A22D3F|nr:MULTISPECIES: riboflavin synthase [Corynebacterium]MDK8823056.1 riboflavin synthase [Corynebacterium coyleae]OFL16292.1 riboflavin synthase subunit alpha [Corynebacterium sp. HMSC067D03]OHO82070.1 riboflavin synthase subunit alpha [Corynebacterium sp. HMSC036E10]OHQ51188.1 riboflavin synthase subunit alpha [Corynebacterium sp. HMSC070H05]PLA37747.1 riboflavin synthase [Corynebacterium coyleae]
MFTGLVEEIGVVDTLEQLEDAVRIAVRASKVTEDASPGDSIAVDGVCLTVVDNVAGVFTADVMRETLDRSRLGTYSEGSKVNLERALAAGQRMGGHIVQGHVDGVAEVVSRTPSQHWEVVRFTLPANLGRYVVEKGSITVNGTSLTVSAVGDDFFEVSLIPTTLRDTTAGDLTVGDPVNLEVDIVAKYVEKMVQG